MTGFVRACGVEDVADESAVRVMIGGRPVAIVRTEDDEIFAIHDVCSHAEVPLSEGEIYEGRVECWLHGSQFDLRSGKPTGLPATKPVPTYPVTVEGDDVLVQMESK